MVTTGTAAVRDWLVKNRVAMWLAAILGGGAIHFALWQVSEPPNLFCDFYKANWAAAEYLWETGLQATWPLTEKGGFSNLPVVGWFYVPLVPLGEERAAWTWWAFGVAALIAAWALLTRLARLQGPAAAGLLFVFIVSGPVVNSLREGQSSHFILLFLVATLVLLRARREYLAGLALGLCALIKLPLLLYGLYFLLRGRWWIVAGGATTIGAAVVVSFALFGVDGHIGWYNEWVAPYLSGYIPAFNVQSVDGFLMRLAKGETFLRHWDPPLAPALWHRIARFCIFAALFGGSFWLMWRADRRSLAADGEGPSARDLLEFSMVVNLALITSPISWIHYYLFLMVPWALYVGGQLPLPDDATTRWLMHGGFLLTMTPIVMWAGEEPGLLNAVLARTVVSVLLVGGSLMFAALARGAWRLRATGSPRPALAGQP